MHNDNNAVPVKTSRHWLLIAAAVFILTAVIIAGIKFFIGSEAQDSSAPDSALNNFKFQGESDSRSPDHNPTARPESGSGGSL